MEKKRGRPKKISDAQPGIMFFRISEIVLAYNKFRSEGMKQSEAVRATVVEVRRRQPHMKVSETEVRSTIAEWQGKINPQDSLIVTENSSGETGETRIVEKMLVKKGPEFGFGPRPKYSRINAKSSITTY
jgi:hypothetical protein